MSSLQKLGHLARKCRVDLRVEEIQQFNLNDIEILFSQSAGRIVVSINPKNKDAFEKIMRNSSFTNIGQVTQNKIIKIKGKGKENVELDIDKLNKEYKSTLGGY